MANVWPTADSFPQKPLIGSAVENDANNVIVTQMDVGPPKIRKRSTSNSESHSYRFLITATNKAAFKTFYASTCSYGSEEFEWDHPETAVTENWRFRSPPVYTYISGYYYLDVELEMMA